MMRKRLLIIIAILIGLCPVTTNSTNADTCHELEIIFIGENTAELDSEYEQFRESMEPKLAPLAIDYGIRHLGAPGISVNIADSSNSIDEEIDISQTYNSVDKKASIEKELISIVNSTRCPNTKYIIAGYSGGASIVSSVLHQLDVSKIIYAATFSDPYIYLPEGDADNPVACFDGELSDYREYVTSCLSYEGLLGKRDPYVPKGWNGKIGAWCNELDIVCTPHFGTKDHQEYGELYEHSSQVIASKIIDHYDLPNEIAQDDDRHVTVMGITSRKPVVNNVMIEAISDSSAKISYDYDASQVIVILNDRIIGSTRKKDFIITNIDWEYDNNVRLVPLVKGKKGVGVTTSINLPKKEIINDNNVDIPTIIPKAPNTGRR